MQEYSWQQVPIFLGNWNRNPVGFGSDTKYQSAKPSNNKHEEKQSDYKSLKKFEMFLVHLAIQVGKEEEGLS